MEVNIPHNVEAEQALLGCFLSDAGAALDETRGRVKAEMFYEGRFKVIFESIASLIQQGKPCHTALVVSDLRDRGQLDSIGGPILISEIERASPPATTAASYFEKVAAVYARRKVLEGLYNAISLAEANTDAQEMLDAAEQALQELSGELAGDSDTSMTEIIEEAISDFEACFENQGKLRGLSTGFSDLDEITSGLQGGEMFVLAGRPSVGKTSLAMNIVDHVAVEGRIPVGVFSLEMTRQILSQRMICSRARVNLKLVKEGKVSERDFPRLTVAASKLSKACIHIDDTPCLSILQVRSRARKWKRRYGIRLLVVDYLQLMHTITKRTENRESEVRNISNGIKGILKELGIPGIILAQLNRNVEKENRRPRMSDLRESGAIEQDADIVGLLYPSEDTPDNPLILPVTLDIVKQRNGETGPVRFTFFRQFTRYEQAARVVANDPDLIKQPYND